MFAAVLVDLVQRLQLGDGRKLGPVVGLFHRLIKGRELGATALGERIEEKSNVLEKIAKLYQLARCDYHIPMVVRHKVTKSNIPVP